MADTFRSFAPEPNCGRGTLSIIWDCLATIFLATWTSTHMRVHVTGWLKERVETVLVFVLFPEGAAVTALDEFVIAYNTRHHLRQRPGWERWSLRQSFLVAKHGVYNESIGSTIDVDELLSAVRDGRFRFGDLPSDQQIRQRSKADGLSKTIAIGQGFWFAANVVSRLVSHYHVSPLEDMTTAYVACGLLMSICWFRCPQDIQEQFVVKYRAESDSSREKKPPGRAARAKTARDAETGASSTTVRRSSTLRAIVPGQSRTHTAASTDKLRSISSVNYWAMFITLLFIFTGVHLASWRYPFPTETEAWVWRAASLVNGVIACVFMIRMYLLSCPNFISRYRKRLYTGRGF